MKPQTKLLLLSAALLFFFIPTPAQIGNILKGGGKLLDKSPSKLMEKYFSNAPITTSFDNARTEVMLLGNFDPEDREFMPLTDLDQNENGDYIVSEGLYSGMNKSFCLKAGTYGPRQGDGHLFAPLVGPKAFLVEKLLENWLTKQPDIPQNNVQSLIWAIIARTDVDKMDIKYKVTLARLLDKEDMVKLAANSLKDKVLEAGMEKLKGEIPSEVYSVFQAEKNLRGMYSSANATYEDFERLAVLAGIAPAEHMIRPVSKARWSYHPNGYFLRMTPHGYSRTKVDVYIPTAVTAATDALGRIQSLSYGGEKVFEFNYGKDGGDNEILSSSGITQIIFPQNKSKKLIKLPLVHALNFVKSDFSFANAGGNTKASQFAKMMNMENGVLALNLDQATRNTLFNLYNAIQSFETLPANAMDPDLGSLVKYLLNEAYNYSIYKNLSLNDKAWMEIKSEDELWVTNQPANVSGPQLNAFEFSPNHFTWYSQDKGVLDLPNTVATPANRSSQRIGQSKPPKSKPWYDKLPDCPCTYAEAQALAKKSGSGWSDCAGANQDFHYGASTEVRWIPPKPGMAGQQCTYDAQGNLITSGIGAGTPDKVSPQGCEWYSINTSSVQSYWGHKTKDMDPWWAKSCETYLKEWPPNNGNKCPDNGAADFDHIKDVVKDMNCDEITKMFKKANDPNDKTYTPRVKDFINGKKSAKELSDAEKSLFEKMRKKIDD